MKTPLRLILLAMASFGLLAAGCMQSKNYVTEKGVNFSDLHTFTVKEAVAANGLDPYRSSGLYKDMTKSVIAMDLEKKGFTSVDTGADFTVTPIWWVSASNTLDNWDSSASNIAANTRSNIESKLEISIEDAKTGKRIWRGWSLYAIQGRDLTEASIKKSVGEALKSFPPTMNSNGSKSKTKANQKSY
ncbi:MAG TPA: hypothetical protein DIU37_06545 [Opitutae bacterium]|nr:hypothetical protein [Opitutae bacterium]